jgi:hypothetical protein
MRVWVIAWALAGCNSIFSLDGTRVQNLDADTRPDIDQDGIADVEDPCISPPEEATSDLDEDGVPDRDDRCPFSGPVTADFDNDGIPDLCDPYPQQGGDRHRCTMTFRNRPLNATLWASRPRAAGVDPMELIPLTGQLVVFGTGEGVATEDVLGSAAAIEIDIPLAVSYAHDDFVAGVLLGAQPSPGISDAACELKNKGGMIGIAFDYGATRVESAPGPLPELVENSTEAASFDLRVYLQPRRPGPNVTCALIYDDTSSTTHVLTATGHIDPPIGRFGLYGVNGFYSFFGLEIFERDDMPSLP